jgi:hypothetical protein
MNVEPRYRATRASRVDNELSGFISSANPGYCPLRYAPLCANLY